MIAALVFAAVLAADPPATTTAQTTTAATTTAAAPAKKDSPLVRAAKAAGGKRKPKGKVITNADVKKTAGKLLTLPPGKPLVTPPPATAEKKDAPLDPHEDLMRRRNIAAKRVGDAERQVADLEAESRRLEQAYYQENDPNVRDNSIAPQFVQAKRQLDLARKELADARDALFALMNEKEQ